MTYNVKNTSGCMFVDIGYLCPGRRPSRCRYLVTSIQVCLCVNFIQGCVRFMVCWNSHWLVFFDRFNPDRFADESVMKSFSLLGFSGSQACPELRYKERNTEIFLNK